MINQIYKTFSLRMNHSNLLNLSLSLFQRKVKKSTNQSLKSNKIYFQIGNKRMIQQKSQMNNIMMLIIHGKHTINFKIKMKMYFSKISFKMSPKVIFGICNKINYGIFLK